ncbi:methyltransferase family protein [Flagellimonas hadalis]|uniref:Isoprenylcysteine carboxylmethyltransferase family protein n=1 Tax=Flagellimonas hadalis TaxID=2597517 RepID=A0A5N5IUP3_9FLAO|nr:isoprenylcysteine carboxylmethyltransferase family protein [Allomuricauda hadalis]KAB5491964.1 isoprenylcysteine carboxylmethyltransferase family protein [Allomuricauda hadalis]
MKLKLPPALVMLLFGGLMYVLAKFLPVGDFDFFGRRELALFLATLGFVVIFISVIQFIKAKTTTDPLSPGKASQLVTSGIYNYTRNPMYLGMLLFLLAFGLKLGNAFNTLLAAGFVSYMNRFQIKGEEEALAKMFGKEYSIYCKLTRRWF